MNEEDDFINELLDEAEALEKKGLQLEAMQVLRNAASMHKDPVVFTRVGVLATDLGLWQEAETALENAIVLERDFATRISILDSCFKAKGLRQDDARTGHLPGGMKDKTTPKSRAKVLEVMSRPQKRRK